MDSFFGIGLFELVMIAIIALVVLGPERLPGAMREVAKYMKQLRSISHEFQSQFSEELKMLEEIDPRRILNEAIDPNAPANTTAAKPPAQAATAAKPAAAATVAGAAAKPSAPAAPAVKPAAPTAPPAITNGEPANTILPPNAEPPAEPPAEPVAAPPVEPPPSASDGGSSTPADSLEPLPTGANPPVDAGLNGHQPSGPAGPNTEAQL
jgi:sec-independent protein translocase protein TatB